MSRGALHDGQGGFGTQSCDNAPGQAWTARNLGSGKPAGGAHSTVRVMVTKDAHGHVHIAVQN